MSSRSADRDRVPAAVDRDATSLLLEALGQLRIQGAIFLHGEYTEPWAYESMPTSDLAALLVPGARRVILFHVIASGRCWIETSSADRHWAEADDVIGLPYGDDHRMGGTEDARHRPERRRRCPTGRPRLRGGIQPRLQAWPRARAEQLEKPRGLTTRSWTPPSSKELPPR